MTLSLKETKLAVDDILAAKLVPNILASPGVGKSDLLRQVAQKYNLKVIDFRLAQSDPTDLNGFPTLNETRTRSHYAPPMNIPLEGDPLPIKVLGVDGEPNTYYAGWLLFFDEMTSAPLAVQAASYKVILDRAVGDQKLHKNVAMACAGNLASDKAIVNRLSTAMQSRLVTLHMHVDSEEWLEWARSAGIDYRIQAYIAWKPDMLHQFKPDHNDVTYPCPRTYEFASKLFKVWGDVSIKYLDILAGALSKGAAAELLLFCDIYKDLPTLSQMISNPASVNTTDIAHDVKFALSSLISHSYTVTNAKSLMSIIKRLPLEFQVITTQNILSRDFTLEDEPELYLWRKLNAAELYTD